MTVMRVVEKKQCDLKCHRRSGCSVRGEGKCDSYCRTGYGVDPHTYTCMSECDSNNSLTLTVKPTLANLHIT